MTSCDRRELLQLGDHTLEGPYRARMEKLVALERRSPLEQREQKARQRTEGSGEQATRGKARLGAKPKGGRTGRNQLD